ncbi:MAG: LysE family translocator [Robiginitomaculum sp.]|nr:LysE family translocator [Robiginitomaculum sp.]MDQ7076540.1 LysE family translocator [Robiginitomaculum sp.]
MNMHIWLTFVLASTLLLATPGPTVLVAVSHALKKGRLAAWSIVLGATLGDFVAMTGSLLGAGAILNASALLFSLLKWFGAAYLIWMGAQLIFTSSRAATLQKKIAPPDTARMFSNAFATTALHPGGFVFFIAFVPLFINSARPALLQFALLEVTFLTLAALNITVWVFLASAARKFLKTRARLVCLIQSAVRF